MFEEPRTTYIELHLIRIYNFIDLSVAMRYYLMQADAPRLFFNSCTIRSQRSESIRLRLRLLVNQILVIYIKSVSKYEMDDARGK